MVKSILVYSFVFFSLFLLCFSLHNFFLENQQIILPYSLKKVYLFHLGFSLVICINFLVFSTVDKIFEQLGFIYLGTILLKLLLFSLIFYKSIFTEEGLPFVARLSLFIPMIVFLLTEAIFVAKILKKKQ
ncbi:DUF6168 family protein [Polaribacter sp. Hel1_85]|uniref:DUF6168 family protein n=1 Tax=Polaribacter sp. Hel1_85 TaxID=1250005 RepID=UPI00052DA600|nr:DUF6168 family protein [Polaribacter sp. Hel1_85]KGL62563.1 hypothetical protein PHEL85_2357 [Polaribacter sp. Hel1_85]